MTGDSPAVSERWLLAWGTGYAAVGAASLLLPLYAIELGAGAFLVGAMASTAAFAGVPGAILWGQLAARTRRRRPFVLVALASVAGVLGIVPLLGSPWSLLVANAALWFVVSAAAPVLNLIVVEGADAAEWDVRIGRLNAVQGYGWVAGLVLGTVWTATVSRLLPTVAAQELLFVVLAAAGAMATLAAIRWYPERPTTSPERFDRIYHRLNRPDWGAGRYLRATPYGTARLYWGIREWIAARRRGRRPGGSFDRTLRKYLVAVGLFSVGFAVFWGPMPVYLTETGSSTGAVFVLFLLANAGSAVCYSPVGRLVGKRGPYTLQAVALGGRALLFPGIAVVGIAAPTVATSANAVGFTLIGVTWALIAVTATGIVTRLAAEPVRGYALGAYTAIAGIGTGLGSIVGGGVAEVAGYPATFVGAGGVVLAALGLFVWSVGFDGGGSRASS
ncbi:Predicted arabinose efflux permease, MFS family [Halopenitus malekzadehii]|uniref:Predicted arabinose efflux permease, MFS family n=1 Tax=Halopenitus malekzadehii TaxID=1267564 RepID=A0A1H6I4K8_9EURY|nr:Predicted arabinose efflux permease, MFS family [Halopenitus malekzadehii]